MHPSARRLGKGLALLAGSLVWLAAFAITIVGALAEPVAGEVMPLGIGLEGEPRRGFSELGRADHHRAVLETVSGGVKRRAVPWGGAQRVEVRRNRDQELLQQAGHFSPIED